MLYKFQILLRLTPVISIYFFFINFILLIRISVEFSLENVKKVRGIVTNKSVVIFDYK